MATQTRRPQHPNAALTPAQRLKMVKVLTEEGWGVAAVAQRFQVDPKTVCIHRYLNDLSPDEYEAAYTATTINHNKTENHNIQPTQNPV